MNHQRINLVLENMKKEKMDYLLISDPFSIEYLVEYINQPGERMYVLLLASNGKHKLFMNTLFYIEDTMDIDIVWYKDTDDCIEIVKQNMDNPKKIGIDKDWPAKFLLSLMYKLQDVHFVIGSTCVDTIRMVKDINEQVLMIEASKINDQAIHEVIKLCSMGYSEIEVASRVEDIYQKLGASGNSFTPIIAYGKNGANPHHENDTTCLKPGDSIIIDMGCRINGYCSDMTRTVFYKEVSKEAKHVYQIVKEANLRAEAMIKPGVRVLDIDKTAREYISDAGYGEEFTHRLGHFIGKDVHEYGDISNSFDLKVQEGMIFSIEPGIYLPNQFGVRIEDLVLVTKDGCKVLNQYPKDLFII